MERIGNMQKLLPLGFALAIAFVAASPANAATIFNAYAAPGVYGPTYNLPGHLGPATYTVSYKVLGKTSVTGEVTYVDGKGKLVIQPFFGSITFRTGKFVAQPKVRFRGVPTGSVVTVIVSP
jgi:hypothetical protein